MALIRTLMAELTERWHALVPRDLFWPGAPLLAPATVRLSQFPLEAEGLAALVKDLPKGGDVDLFLPSAALLRLQINLPAIAATETDAAITLRLRQTMPKQAEGLVWRRRADARTAEGHTYSVYIAKADQLATLVSGFGTAGHRVRSVRTELDRMAPFYLAGAGARAQRLWRNLALGVTAASLIWVAISLNIRTRAVENANTAVSEEIADLQNRAVQAREAADLASKDGNVAQDALHRLSMHRERALILADLTVALPDMVWISELTISDKTLYLSGFADGDVRHALEILEGLSWARSVKLDGPIIPDNLTGESRFQAIVEIADPGFAK